MGWDTAQPGASPEPLTAHGHPPNLEELIFCNYSPAGSPSPPSPGKEPRAEQVKEHPLPQVAQQPRADVPEPGRPSHGPGGVVEMT